MAKSLDASHVFNLKKKLTSVLNLYEYYYQGNQKNGVSRFYFLMLRWPGQLFCAFSDIVSVVVLKQTNKCVLDCS